MDMDAARADLASKKGALTLHFRAAVLGGDWTEENTGGKYDNICGLCRGDKVEEWCVAKDIQKSFRCNVPLYSDAEAGILVRAWVARMQYLYDLSVGSKTPYARATPEDFAHFSESTEFVTLAAGARALVLRRINQIRAIF